MRLASWMSVTSLVLCAVGASVTLWRPPLVFPLSSALWWATTGTVLALWLVTGLAVVGALVGRQGLCFVSGLVPGVLLLFGSLVGRFVFERTDGAFFGIPFCVGALWVVTTWRAHRQLARSSRLSLAVVSLAAGPLGAMQPLGRAPSPVATVPALTSLSDAGVPSSLEGLLVTSDGHLQFACGHGLATLGPLLRFQDASDDGFWPITHTPTVERAKEPPALWGPLRRASLTVALADGGFDVDAETLVPKPTASHLSRYADLVVTGFHAPSLRFEATGATDFPLAPFDYPKGRPAHFAAMTKQGELVVWRGSNAEKGPFVELGRGPLRRGDPLTLVLVDDGVAQCSLRWLDFTAQADVTLSPTAGEGVPVNAVQFGKPANDESKVLVLLSLASTGIGAGMETVWHAEGVYRNRLLVRSGAWE